MNEPRVYQNSPALLILIIVFAVVGIAALSFSLGFQTIAFTIPIWVIGLLLLVSMFMALFNKVVLTEDEISVKSLFGTKTLRWTEIGRASGSGYRIKLQDRDGDVTLSPSSRLPKYEEIVDFIGRKRPDLFSPQEYSEMRRGWASILQAAFILLFLGGILVLFAYAVMDSADTSFSGLAAGAIFVLMILVYGGMTLFAPRALVLEGNTLTVKYLFREKTFTAAEIAFVQLGYTQTRNGRQYYVALYLKGKGNIRISGLAVGLPIAYLVLKNWLQSRAQGQSAGMGQAPNDVAPNWSDNSGR